MTNAAKFGAFSLSGGTVSVVWKLTADGGIEMSWREAGGPPVIPPSRRGFGSTLIERALAMETGGHARMSYLPGGVVCDIFLPATSVLRHEPPTDAAPSILPAPEGAPVASATGHYRILVVEDSFLLVMMLQDLFEGLGWHLVGPGTRLSEALELARNAQFDAALLDVNLDGAMSWEVAAILKDRGLPFVFSTGYDVAGVLPPDLAGSRIIAKPFDHHAVEELLRLAISDGQVA